MCDVVDALVIANVIVVFDEGSDLLFKIARSLSQGLHICAAILRE